MLLYEKEVIKMINSKYKLAINVGKAVNEVFVKKLYSKGMTIEDIVYYTDVKETMVRKILNLKAE